MFSRYQFAVRAFVISTATLVSSLSGAEDGLVDPYIVFAAHENAYARCGPAGEFYRTDPLRVGQELDVYLETDDGWLGIRPPDGSFSWVPAANVEPDAEGDSGTIVGHRAVAWIGTQLGRARKYRWQVQLAEGERVSILGKTERESGNGPELWYRIVPPSGEFRWIHRSQIAESSEQLVQMHRQFDERDPLDAPEQLGPRDSDEEANALQTSSDAIEALGDVRDSIVRAMGDRQPASGDADAPSGDADAASGAKPQADLVSETADAESEIPAISTLPDEPVGSGVAPASFKQPKMAVGEEVQLRDIDSQRSAVPPADDLAADDQTWVTGTRPASASPAPSITPAPAPSITPAPTPSITPAPTAGATLLTDLRETSPPTLTAVDPQQARSVEQAARDVSRRMVNADLDDLQLELSRQMAAGAQAAVVEPLRRRVQMWIEKLSDPLERERARVLLERVEQYQRIARRRDGQPPLVQHQGGSDAEATTAAAATSSASGPAATTATVKPFDREGYLVQVFSARPDSPPFAITNGAGQTLAYVSPAPGVNLRAHLNAKVGLNGKLSYLTGLETPHFIAQQIVRISR